MGSPEGGREGEVELRARDVWYRVDERCRGLGKEALSLKATDMLACRDQGAAVHRSICQL